MGRRNTLDERVATVKWARNFLKKHNDKKQSIPPSLLKSNFEDELKRYFALSALSRSTKTDPEIVNDALKLVFPVRVKIERIIGLAIQGRIADLGFEEFLAWGSIFGASKKQGVSMRVQLESCMPTKLCASSCYAHDVLDAAPAPLIRGVINGQVAGLYESATEHIRSKIENGLVRHTRKAVHAALEEATSSANAGWSRRAFIRFSHVGEIAAYPSFANCLAKQVWQISNGEVDCVIYTRHRKAKELNPELWIINFTLDGSSRERREWAPDESRLVFSAFGGETDPEAEINFLEHHRWTHVEQKGTGNVCPATAPNVEDRTCDSLRCNTCFIKTTDVRI